MNLKQTDKRLSPYINKYGCLFMCLAYAANKDFTPDELNEIWKFCIEHDYISGDENNDGDMDDTNELIILDHDAVAKALGAHMAYTNRHYEPNILLPAGYYYVGQYYNPKTQFKHFVTIDRNKRVIYDPIKDSNTVKNGYLYSIRLYKYM